MLEVREAVQVALPAPAETLDILGARFSVLCSGDDLPLMVGEQVVPQGYGVPPHVHDDDDEVFVVLDGTLTVTGPGGETQAGAGACVQLRRGAAHSFRNDSAGPVRMLVIALPGRQALEMFRHFDRAGRQPVPATPSEIAAIAGRYGVRFV